MLRTYAGLHVLKRNALGSKSASKYPISLSFLKPAQFNETEYPIAIIGWLKSAEAEDIKPDNFVENEPFNRFLHKVIAQNYVGDPTLQNAAKIHGDGFSHVIDWRNPPPHGRIPDPEDIFGTVQIEKGKLLPNTYQEMPTHRIVSSYGLFMLSDYLRNALINATLASLKLK